MDFLNTVFRTQVVTQRISSCAIHLLLAFSRPLSSEALVVYSLKFHMGSRKSIDDPKEASPSDVKLELSERTDSQVLPPGVKDKDAGLKGKDSDIEGKNELTEGKPAEPAPLAGKEDSARDVSKTVPEDIRRRSPPVSDGRFARSSKQNSPERRHHKHQSRSRTDSISPPPRHSRRPSRSDRSPYNDDRPRFRGRSRSPDEFRDRGRYRGSGRPREPPRDRYRERSPDRYRRRDDYPRRRNSRSRSRERYSHRYRSPSPKRSRRGYYDETDPERERDMRYGRRSRRSRSRTRSPSPPRRRRSRDTISNDAVLGAFQAPFVGYSAVGVAQPNATHLQPGMVGMSTVPYPPGAAPPGVVPYPTYMAAPVAASGTYPQAPVQNAQAGSVRYNASQNNQQIMTKSRRLYVGNLPFQAGLSEMALVHFFNALHMAAFGTSKIAGSPPVLSVWLHQDGKFGFMETRSDQDAVDVMQFNGVSLHGRPLRVNRPSDYNPAIHNPSAASLVPQKMNYTAVVELCGKLGGVAGPPPAPPAHQIIDEKDMKASGMDEPNTNGQTLLSTDPTDVKREEQLGSGSKPSLSGPPMLRSTPAPRPSAANVDAVVSLKNIVTSMDLDGSDEDYKALVDDIREECTQYGRITSILIPRQGAGRGTAFIGFSQKEEAMMAVEKLSERAFDNRVVKAIIVAGAANAEDAVRSLEGS